MKEILVYTLLLIALLIALLQQWIIVAIVLTMMFSWRYRTHALIVVGVLVDGYFGAFSSVPAISLLALCWFVSVESLRDQLTVNVDSRVY